MSEPAKKRNPLGKIGYAIAIFLAVIYLFDGLFVLNSKSTSFFASGLQIVTAIVLFTATLLCLATHRELRKIIGAHFGGRFILPIMVAAIIVLGLLGAALGQGFDSRRQDDAKAQSYTSAEEFDQANAAGYRSANDYHTHLKQAAEKAREAARKKAEEDAKYAAAEKLVVGRWLMPIDAQYMITIRHKGDGYEEETLWHNGDTGVHALRERMTQRGARFDVVGDVAHTYYVILANGDLDIRDKDGEFIHAVPFHEDARNLSKVDAALDQAKQDLLDAQKKNNCRTNLICAAQKYMDNATEECREPIEAQARWDHKWTDGLFGGPMFAPVALWHGKNGMKRHLVDFIGDKLKLENGFGAWRNYVYVCTIDVSDGHIVNVSLRPGQLPGGL